MAIFGLGIGLFIGLVLAAIAFTTAIPGLWWGLRGKRIDDHPLCRKCGFDLTGRPDASMQCSECGADLQRPNAIRIGHRAKRRGVVVASLAVLLLGLLMGSLVAILATRKFNPLEYAPMWYVEIAVLGPSGIARDDGVAETQRRMKLPNAKAATFQKLIGQLLAAQGDETKPWAGAWGDLLENFRQAQMLSDAQAKQYFSQLVKIKIITRPEVRPGADVPVQVNVTLRGNSRDSYPGLGYRMYLTRPDGRSAVTWTGGSLTNVNSKFMAARLRDGQTEIQGYFAIVRPVTNSNIISSGKDRSSPPADALMVIDLTRTFRPAVGEDPIEAVTDLARVSQDCDEMSVHAETYLTPKNQPAIRLTLTAKPRQTSLAYEIYLVTPNANLKMGDCMIPKGQKNALGYGFETELPELLSEDTRARPQLLLVPAPQLLRETAEYSSYLNIPLQVSGFAIVPSDTSSFTMQRKSTVTPTTRPDPATTRPWKSPWWP